MSSDESESDYHMSEYNFEEDGSNQNYPEENWSNPSYSKDIESAQEYCMASDDSYEYDQDADEWGVNSDEERHRHHRYKVHNNSDFISLWESMVVRSQSGSSSIPIAGATANYSVDDSFEHYVISLPFAHRRECTERTYASSSQLYVGNLPAGTNKQELRKWFESLGYGVTRINEIRTKAKGVGFTSVRFNTNATARRVLNRNKAAGMKFQKNKLNIRRSKSVPIQTTNTTSMATENKSEETRNDFEISDVYYGTPIRGAALKNFEKESNDRYNAFQYGIIAKRLETELKSSFHLTIDTQRKKLIIKCMHVSTGNILWSEKKTSTLYFMWDLSDVTGKITPVLVDEKDVFLLVKFKRIPLISEEQTVAQASGNKYDINRLPAFKIIGHTNAWLFKLSATNTNDECKNLIHILNRYNLSSRDLSDQNAIEYIQSNQAAQKRLMPIMLISSDEWMKRNEDKVNEFLKHRWPSYPFETKFEIMKLISKHIITVHDLILDEAVEQILSRCSINTLVSLTDKIIELEPEWSSTACDNTYQSRYHQSKEEKDLNGESERYCTNTEKTTTVSHSESVFQNIRSCTTGEVVDATDISIVSNVASIQISESRSESTYTRTFSDLLLKALKKLIKNHEICQIQTTKFIVTQLELRTTPSTSLLTRKIYVTPSSILYEGPYLEEKCVVTRKFERYQDRFLRVAFRDEDYGYLRDFQNDMTKINEHIKTVLNEGVIICGRHFEFLAFSSSQLRDHSCWMFAATEDHSVTAESIRKWLGDFSNIRPVAKLAARLGQSFSATIKGIQIDTKEIKEIPDLEGEEYVNGYSRRNCFTDGIGIIAQSLTKRLSQEIKLPDHICPSAFQVRCGGYKGMLCVDVANCITDPDRVVYFRKSMSKFEAPNYSIDVIRSSFNASLAYLNRQIILLLSSLGIRDEVFISLQDHMLSLICTLTGEQSEKVCETIRELGEFRGNGYHRFLIDYLIKLPQQRDPFAQELLQVMQTYFVKVLRTTARILVPNSWHLLGVADETQTLNYGEVFIQIDNSDQENHSKTTQILKGPVIVTRNPCLHPGDIRKLNAVDVPGLRGLKNVIVFPVKPPRPHPKEMSGGDLDGDTFWISSHSELIIEKNEEPFDYQQQADDAKLLALSSFDQCSIKDVCNFFGEYIAADNLGIIANSHLAFADQLEQGVRNLKCLELARMHSVAVDFAKTGLSASKLTAELRPTKYPHFMEKKDKENYKSNTILGRLYDQVQRYENSLASNEKHKTHRVSSFPFERFDFAETHRYVADARIIKEQYDRDLKGIMRQYGIQREAEVVSGYILNFTAKQHEKVAKSYELRQEISHAYKVIREN